MQYQVSVHFRVDLLTTDLFRHHVTVRCFPNVFFFFSFGVLQLMLPEIPQPYILWHTGLSNFLHQFRSATPPKQRKLDL
jgi:hypothetical protein